MVADPAPGLPLRRGASGAAVRDLHRRLSAAGWRDLGPLDVFDDSTEVALRGFQAAQKLVDDGVCGPQTWRALVDADYRLGDRMIYLRSPMTRGDDVTDLQHRLGALGFDAGWLDGIFGPDTEAAVRDFQHNQGLTADGVVGRETVAALLRLAGRAAGDKTVAEVRDRERLFHHDGVTRERIVIGHDGGVPAIAEGLARQLRLAGADVLSLHQPDLSDQARAANTWKGSVYLGVGLADATHRIAYFETEGFVSHGGRALAVQCAAELRDLAGDATTCGMRLPILRETRMPAVWCRLGPPAEVVEHSAGVVEALASAIRIWCIDPPT